MIPRDAAQNPYAWAVVMSLRIELAEPPELNFRIGPLATTGRRRGKRLLTTRIVAEEDRRSRHESGLGGGVPDAHKLVWERKAARNRCVEHPAEHGFRYPEGCASPHPDWVFAGPSLKTLFKAPPLSQMADVARCAE